MLPTCFRRAQMLRHFASVALLALVAVPASDAQARERPSWGEAFVGTAVMALSLIHI